MISEKEYLMDRDKEYPLTPELVANMKKLLAKVNIIRKAWDKPMLVTSGYRPKAINDKTPGASLKSLHMECLAIDIEDKDGKLKQFLLENQHWLQLTGLYMEHPEDTKGWCHLQAKSPPSGFRIFRARGPTKALLS